MAGRAQASVAQKRLQEHVLGEDVFVRLVIGEFQEQGVRFPAIFLMSEKRSPRGRARACFLFGNIGFPDARRRHPLADHIYTEQVRLFPAPQKASQPLDLARRAGEQDFAPRLQRLFRLGIGIPDGALQVLAAAQRRQSLPRLHRDVVHTVLVRRHGRTEHHPALCQHLLGQRRKDATARAFAPYRLVPVDCRVGRRLFALRLRLGVQDRADLFAQTALDAGRRVDPRVQKAFFRISASTFLELQ